MLRQALFSWAFNPATRDTDPPEKIADALDWAEVLVFCCTTRAQPAQSTVVRKW